MSDEGGSSAIEMRRLISLANATPEYRRLINELIDEICRAVDAPYYRRDRQLIWCTLIATVIGVLMGAGASAWFSSRSQEKGPLQPAPLGVATACVTNRHVSSGHTFADSRRVNANRTRGRFNTSRVTANRAISSTRRGRASSRRLNATTGRVNASTRRASVNTTTSREI